MNLTSTRKQIHILDIIINSKLVLLASCLAFFCSCGQSRQGEAKAPECAVTTVQATSVSLSKGYSATLKGKQDVEIRPMVSGFITKLYVDEGATVRQGQALFAIDPVQYQAAANAAKAGVETAKAMLNTQELTLENRKQLRAKNIISEYDLKMAQNQYDQAKAALQQAQSQLISAQKNLAYTTVTSPSNGVVGSVPYRVGSLVSPSVQTPLTTVSDISSLYAYFSMTERDLLKRIQQGGSMQEILKNMPEVQLQLIDGSIYAEKGKVETISGVIDNSTGSVTLRALFPNPKNILRSGSTVQVVFPVSEENVFVIPQSATVEIQDKKFVFVVQADNTVKSTEITVNPVDDGKSYIVQTGLKNGDRVVLENVQNLKDGSAIKPITPAQKEEIYQQNLKDQKEGNIQSAMQ